LFGAMVAVVTILARVAWVTSRASGVHVNL
jgi:hypothetical protein